MTSSQEQTGVLRRALRRLHRSEAGQGLVEYALIIVVVSLGSLVALNFLGDEVSNLFNKAGSSIRTGADGTGGGGNPGLTDQTIAFGALSNRALGSGTFTVSATASSGLTVAFTSATAPQCTVAGTTVTLVAVGTCTINANQAGNGTYNPAPQVAQSFQITAAATSPPVPGTVSAISCTNTSGGGTCQDQGSASVTPGTWTGTPTPTISYQWAYNSNFNATCDTTAGGWTNIGTNSATVTVPDTGSFDLLRVIVTGTNTDPGSPVSVVRCRQFDGD